MRRPGQVALVPFPRVDMTPGKPRPVLLLAETPGTYHDWLICMFSTRLYQAVSGFDRLHSFTQMKNQKIRENL